jgi:hypothetical protein
MSALHTLTEYKLETIESFITNEIEESINIEFKSSGALSRTPSIKKEISKDVSAFANSDGGIIIYGIEEKNHRAHSLSFINGDEFTKEFLEQVINSTIKRAVPNIKIFAIRSNGDLNKSIYVVQIPSSVEAPHMNQDKRFYRRYNFESIMMDEYDVREMYGRKIQSELAISDLSISIISEDGKEDETRFRINLAVKNTGESLVKDYRANLYVECDLKNCNSHWEALGQGKNYSYIFLDNEVKLTNELSPSIFPSEKLGILKINFDVKTSHLESFIRSLKFRGKIFYGNKQVEKKFNKQNIILEDYLEKKGVFKFLNEIPEN